MNREYTNMASRVGTRLLPSTIDEIAASDPDRVWACIPRDGSDISKGYKDITYRQFANAINHAAAWLGSSLGGSVPNAFEVATYQGLNDHRLPALAVAIAKVGKQLLIPFSLAPTPVKQHLIDAANCKFCIYSEEVQDQLKGLLDGRTHIRPVVIPPVDTWFTDVAATHYPYHKSWDEGQHDPWLIFHTSGTTGFPKLVTYTNRMMTSFDIAQILPSVSQESTQLSWHRGKRVYSIIPMSHFSGMTAALQSTVFLGTTLILGPPSPPSPPLVMSILQYGKVDGFVSIPSVLRSMVLQPQCLELLKRLKFIQWIGAPLDNNTGTVLSQHTRICPAMGTTECGPYFLLTPDSPSDWAYYIFQPGQGITFEAHGDHLFELVFHKNGDALWQQAFLLFPEKEVYRTGDLFAKHLEKEGLWMYAGRSDDMVVLANGANVNAANIEEKLMQHLDVSLAMVGGSGKDRTFAIVELGDEALRQAQQGGKDKVLEGIWRVVEAVNKELSDYTRLTRDSLLICGGEKRLVRGPKGNVVRGASLRNFSEEIEELFRK
ncbi:acetyl-CoA synthetase-like protein [Corynespora cassiicola Philippines]|uniref:Acetyl-CoA synthetase-like protein n=1 Tax=Corynespora cassiicola Philippines TaxID=1448308 RepID=A0A2T2NTE7_CORCC|nr:acetyl-CoA synthetase-like protein [Corynespora cassiicola Philippines]